MEACVRVSKHALDYFRKKARDCPFEVQAYLIGEVKYPNYTITSFEHPKEYHLQTENNVQPSGEAYSKVKEKAYLEGRRIIGDIHSHPDWDAVMSPTDYEAGISDGLQICGIVSVRGRKTKVRFWQANSALPCEIKYV
jgi:proteasome lid subunit RPN8/RPN11